MKFNIISEIRALMDNGYFDQALIMIKEYMVKDANNAEVNYLYAFCLHVHLKDYMGALKYYNIAEQLGFDRFWISYNRGPLYGLSGDIEESINDYRTAKEMQPFDMDMDNSIDLAFAFLDQIKLTHNQEVQLMKANIKHVYKVVDCIRAQYDSLKKIVFENRKVDLVDFGNVKVFMYTDDLGYISRLPGDARKGQNITDLLQNNAIGNKIPDYHMGKVTDGNLIYHIMNHYWNNGLDFTILDIGCKYGSRLWKLLNILNIRIKQTKSTALI